MLREIWEDRDDRVCANCARFPEAKPKSASRYLCTFAEFYGEDGADENGWIGAESPASMRGHALSSPPGITCIGSRRRRRISAPTSA